MKIALCSSTSFYDHLHQVSSRLTKAGWQVFEPKTSRKNATWLKDDGSKKYLKWRKNLIDTHFRVIEKSDAILVVNDTKNGIDGYIGANTLMEMTVAYYLGKKIFIFNDISSENSVYDEIVAMGVTMLGGDISKISM